MGNRESLGNPPRERDQTGRHGGDFAKIAPRRRRHHHQKGPV